MKLVVIFFITICLNAGIKLYAQTVSLDETNCPLDAIFKKIKKQTDYNFAGTKELLKKASPVNIHLENTPLNSALEQIFAEQPLDYTVYNKVIIIKDRDALSNDDQNLQDNKTYIISGTVSDEKGVTIPGATVFLANTESIISTNSAGRFILNDVQPGTYEIAVKMLGYSVYSQPILIQKKSPDLHIVLKENVITLNTININAISKYEKKKYLQLFTQFFIGESENASKSKLLNPEVVNFSFDINTATLEATSDEFIVIKNKSLGYKMHCLLREFSLDMNNYLLTYSLTLYFEEMEGTKSQKQKWANKRQSTFEGSIGHFFKAAFANKLKEEGFLVYRFPDKEALSNLQGKAVNPKNFLPLSRPDSLFINIDRNIKLFDLKELKKDSTDLYIVYTRKSEPDAYRSVTLSTPFMSKLLPYQSGFNVNLPFIIPPGPRQISIIHPLMDSMLVNKNGNVTRAKNLLRSGFWSWLRTADLLPPDYKMPEKPAQSASVSVTHEIINALDTIRRQLPAEKLYLQLDKPYYTLGDTLRFKSYLVKGDFLVPSAQSGLLYVELDNEDNKPVKQMMIPVEAGVGWGDIALGEKDIPQGNYTLRAYTNWMRNFGENRIFKKDIYISAVTDATLINTNFKREKGADKDKIQASLHFTGLNSNPVRLKDMQLSVMNGKRILFKDKAITGMDGSMDLNFDLDNKTPVKNLTIQAQAIGKGTEQHATLTIPVTLNRVENTDLQFMPEGGAMVAGTTAKTGFKALGEDGKGITISGKIYNSKQQEVSAFHSVHAGMGSFEFLPLAGEIYTARITSPAGINKTYALPPVNLSGTTLRVMPKGADSLLVSLSITADMVTNPVTYSLIGQSRGVVCYAGLIKFNEKQLTINRTIAKDLFATGVARFTLLNDIKLPLNERIVYINHQDNLQINITDSKPTYGIRDSIALAITVKDKAGKPVQGTFSVAVTDDSQVRTDSTDSNIIDNMLFTSDLKGTIEQPGYYLQNINPKKVAELDNLMLTQGWVGYDWKQVFDENLLPVKYPAEPEFVAQGKVTNIFNKPVAGSGVVLYSKRPLAFRDTVTDKDGNFTFKGLFPVDTAIFKLQARNKSGNSFNVGITAREFTSPVFTTHDALTPWYVNSDTILLNNSHTKAAGLKAAANYRGEGNVLQEVTIKDKKIVKSSKNLNGAGEADLILDESDMGKATHLSLFRLLQQKFGRNIYRQAKDMLNPEYHLFIHKVNLVIDGIFINDYQLSTDTYMNMLSAEDIKGIEIMRTTKYALAYDPDFTKKLFGKEENVPIYLEVTTYPGHGAFINSTPGTYLYKTLAFSLPKQFYRPRYTAKNSNVAMGTDLRSTIHWEPNVITDAEGKATLSFFSADKPAGYTVIIEGTDLQGEMGYQRQQIKVAAGESAAK